MQVADRAAKLLDGVPDVLINGHVDPFRERALVVPRTTSRGGRRGTLGVLTSRIAAMWTSIRSGATVGEPCGSLPAKTAVTESPQWSGNPLRIRMQRSSHPTSGSRCTSLEVIET